MPLGAALNALRDRYLLARPREVNRAREIALLVGILTVGVLLRLYRLDALSLWLDEAFTWYVASVPVTDILSLQADIHPPIYFLVEKLALAIWGNSEFALRLSSALFGSASILIVYLMGRRFVGPVAGLVAAAILATSSSHIEYSQEARNYAMLFLELGVAVAAR